MDPVKLVLAGCGGIARAAHLPALSILRDEGLVEIAGLCDLDEAAARRTAAEFRVAATGPTLTDLVRRTGATAVSICVPPGPNVALALEALSLDLPVMTEKPPARRASQARLLAEAADVPGGPVTMVAFNRRYAPLYMRAMEASRALGAPHLFHARFTRPSLGQAPSNTAEDWITSDGSHALDLVVAAIGMPAAVSVTRRRVGRGPDNVWTVQLHGTGGAATLVFDFSAGRRVERFEWSGAGYDVCLELPGRCEWAAQNRPVETWTPPARDERTRIAIDYGFVDEYRAFLAAIGGGPRPATDFAYAQGFMRLVEAILGVADGGTARVDVAPSVVAAEAAAPRALRSTAGIRPARPTVLILQDAAARQRHFDAAALARLSGKCELLFNTGDDWRDALPRAHAVVAGWGAPAVTGEYLERATTLQLAVVVGAAVRALEPERLLARGVSVCNTADAIARSVAEHALTLTLAGLRRLTDVDRAMHAGGWPPSSTGRISYQAIKRRLRTLPGMAALKPTLLPAVKAFEARRGLTPAATPWRDLDGLVVGLIGWGQTARHFARLLAPFGCDVVVYSERATDAELDACGTRRASLGEILAGANVVSMHRGLTDRTKGSIGARELALLKPGTVLVNTARGALIDEAALVARLRRGDIVAALDVYDEEPLPKGHALRPLPNAILTPHNASSTPECRRRAGQQALAAIEDWLDGRRVSALSPGQITSMT